MFFILFLINNDAVSSTGTEETVRHRPRSRSRSKDLTNARALIESAIRSMVDTRASRSRSRSRLSWSRMYRRASTRSRSRASRSSRMAGRTSRSRSRSRAFRAWMGERTSRSRSRSWAPRSRMDRRGPSRSRSRDFRSKIDGRTSRSRSRSGRYTPPGYHSRGASRSDSRNRLSRARGHSRSRSPGHQSRSLSRQRSRRPLPPLPAREESLRYGSGTRYGMCLVSKKEESNCRWYTSFMQTLYILVHCQNLQKGEMSSLIFVKAKCLIWFL